MNDALLQFARARSSNTAGVARLRRMCMAAIPGNSEKYLAAKVAASNRMNLELERIVAGDSAWAQSQRPHARVLTRTALT